MILFKYCNASGIIILESNLIKISSPSEFNDPFDCRPWIDTKTEKSRAAIVRMVKEHSILASMVNDPKRWNRNQRRAFDKRLNSTIAASIDSRITEDRLFEAVNKMKILCLSATCDSHLMWSHYSGSHTGIMIEIESDGFFEIGDLEGKVMFQKLFKIDYTITRPCLSFDSSGKEVLLKKGEEWRYENEWRVLFDQSGIIVGDIEGKPATFTRVPENVVRNVYLGCNFDLERIPDVRAVLNSPRYSHVGLFHKVLHPRQYALSNERLK